MTTGHPHRDALHCGSANAAQTTTRAETAAADADVSCSPQTAADGNGFANSTGDCVNPSRRRCRRTAGRGRILLALLRWESNVLATSDSSKVMRGEELAVLEVDVIVRKAIETEAMSG